MKKILRCLGIGKPQAILKVGSRTFRADKIDVVPDNTNDTIHIYLEYNDRRKNEVVVMSNGKWMDLINA